MIKLKLSEFHYEDDSTFYMQNSGYTWLAEKDGFTVRVGEIWRPAIVKQINLLDVELCREFNTSNIELVFKDGWRSPCYWTSMRELKLIKARNSYILRRDQDEVYRSLVTDKSLETVRELNRIMEYAVLEGFMPLEIAIPYAESIVVFGREDDILSAV